MKYFIVFLLVVVLTDVNAQTGTGSWMIGGSMSIKHTKTDQQQFNAVSSDLDEGTDIGLSPTVGYFPVKNFLIGVQTTLSRRWTPDDSFKSNTSGAGPMLRYYFPFGKFAVFPEVVAVVSNSNTQSDFTTFDPLTGDPEVVTIKQTTKSTRYQGGVGFVWFAATNIGIEGILGYRKSKDDSDAGQFGSRTYKQSQVYFNVGLQFYLSRKTEGN